jgi:hypothetical protein
LALWSADWKDHRLAPSRAQEPRRARCCAHAPHLPADTDHKFYKFRIATSWDGRGRPAGHPHSAQIRRLGGKQRPRFHRDHRQKATLSCGGVRGGARVVGRSDLGRYWLQSGALRPASTLPSKHSATFIPTSTRVSDHPNVARSNR